MPEAGILIVDDEKHIRQAMSEALEPLGYDIDTAASGDAALEYVAPKEFKLILLELNTPGLEGLDVLRRVVEQRPEIRVIIVSEHGSLENAVEAMKLGATDFIRKPFVPEELRDLVAEVLDRAKIEASQSAGYETHLSLIKHCINERHFEAAMEHARQAIGTDPARPEAFNLLGVLHEIAGHHDEAMKNYRAAIDMDPTYQPAWQNLNRPTRPDLPESGPSELDLG